MDNSEGNQSAGRGLRAALHSYVHVPRGPKVKPYFKLPRAEAARTAALSPGGPWNVPDLCVAYNWPTGLDGGGVIAIVELGGGWVQSDMDKFFGGIGQPAPHITDVSVDGTQNTPDPSPDSADGEVALDIEVAAAGYYAATSKPATIRVYWARDIASAVRAATADGCDVCSISWGADEANWGAQAGQDMERAAADATAAGMVVFAASGDNDSSDGGSNPANVDLPASAPHVIGCGGTRKTPTDERVWNNDPGNPSGNGTGGGFSTLFPLPDWQVGVPNGPGRMVPDLGADADPETGYNIVVHGTQMPIGGTSAVAPLYAGLFAAFGTKLGWITPQLYLNQVCFNDIRQGDNGAFRAGVGPDPCTGLGSPIAAKLSQLFVHPAATPMRRLKDAEAENKRLRAEIARLTRS
ncbi:MAG TPA: S53 family peptidase [Stellaceae bacterium]|nr:S53 family peptidase [Stellaceae bacterium]